MPELAILVHGQRHGLSFQPGPSLRELLDRSAYRVRSACLGHGACGLCRVRLLAGDAGPPQAAEKLQLSEAQLADGLRLACQIRPRTDLTVEIINPAAPSGWRTPPTGLSGTPAGFAADRHELMLGVNLTLARNVTLGFEVVFNEEDFHQTRSISSDVPNILYMLRLIAEF